MFSNLSDIYLRDLVLWSENLILILLADCLEKKNISMQNSEPAVLLPDLPWFSPVIVTG